MVDTPSVFQLINTGVQILMGEFPIFSVKQVDQFEIGSMCHLVDDSLQGLCHSALCNH